MQNIPKYIIIHCSAISRAQYPKQFTIINVSHKDREFPLSSLGYYVGYHKLSIGGIEYKTRNENEEGAHCNQLQDGISMNFQSLGYCLGFHGDYETPDPRDVLNMRNSIKEWQKQYNIPDKNILYHRYYATNKSCPGNLIKDGWIFDVLKDDYELRLKLSLLQHLVALYTKLSSYKLGGYNPSGCGAEKG